MRPFRQSSRPAWGAWIEIEIRTCRILLLFRRAPYGARGLKFRLHGFQGTDRVVAPRKGCVD